MAYNNNTRKNNTRTPRPAYNPTTDKIVMAMVVINVHGQERMEGCDTQMPVQMVLDNPASIAQARVEAIKVWRKEFDLAPNIDHRGLVFTTVTKLKGMPIGTTTMTHKEDLRQDRRKKRQLRENVESAWSEYLDDVLA